MSQETGQILRFGEYELDPAGRSLRLRGERVSINPRAFDVLLFLARHSGQVVSREDLLKNVWKDSFVDENTLSQSISSLRRTLAEKPGQNSFVATLPGRGYQFLAPVQVVNPAGATGDAIGDAILVGTRTIRTSIVTERDERISTRPALSGRVPWARKKTAVVSTITLVVFAAAGLVAWRLLRPAPYSHVEAVIAALDNETGDADFDHPLSKILQVDLQQSPFFTVVSDGRAHRTLKLMNHPTDEVLTAPIAREVCQRLNGQVYLTPSIASIAGHYLVVLLANDCADGHVVSARRAEVSAKSAVLGAFSGLIPKVRRDVGESHDSLHNFDKPLYAERTSSLEALNAYSEAERLGDSGKYPESIALFHRAIDLDPKFAIAYADMGSMYFNMGDKAHDAEAITKAYAMRDTLNERELLYIQYHYSQNISGDLHAELDALRQWSSLYPDDNIPLTCLANLETSMGHYPQSAAYAEQTLAIEHRNTIRNGISNEISARAFYHANMPDKFRAVYNDATQWKSVTEGLHASMLEFSASNGDTAGVDREISLVRGTPAESHILQYAAFAALSAGQVRRAEKLFADATAAAQRDQLTATLADGDEYHVRTLIELGLADRARELFAKLPQEDSTLDKLFAEAELQSPEQAVAEARRRQAAAPTDTLLNAVFVPSVEAMAALRAGHAQQAVDLMQPSAPYELRDPTVAYLRGVAFLAAHRTAEAEAEFRKLIDQPWIGDPISPITALSELELARTLALEGQNEKAAEAYHRFISDWNNADPDLPVLMQARTEEAKLNSSR
jgi:DNA-binding winged helix-turn-helix (wHTH) protein/tetratricopeptide (TPR) repeat protein